MGGKYEIRFFVDKKKHNIDTIYTNSWIMFMKLRILCKLHKKLIYYKVYGMI